MSDKAYIIYPDTAKSKTEPELANVVIKSFVDEPGQVSFGTIDFVPGWYLAPHHHHTWELIIVDASSEGPGFVYFDDRWWRADPGCGVFVPVGYSHCWSAGNDSGFKMLWVYAGSHEEAGRVYDVPPETFRAITPEEERSAPRWTPKD